MTICIYRSDDSGAPELLNTSGSFASLFKTLLVGTGGIAYGSKASAGWTTEIDNTNVVLLKNASGRYVRIKDDGIAYTGQSIANYTIATITGSEGYTAIDELIQPYPRTITGTNLHSTNFHGLVWIKASSVSDACSWICIADSKTCYFIFCDGTTTKNNFIHLLPVGFGDLGLLANISNWPVGFVAGGGFENATNAPYIHTWLTTQNDFIGYMEHPLTGGAQSTKFFLRKAIGTLYLGARKNSGLQLGLFKPYSEIANIAQFEPIYIMDDTNNVVRTSKHTGYETELFGKLRGIYACSHMLDGNTGDLGNEFDILTVDDREYLLMYLPHTGYGGPSLEYGAFAFDLTGPW